ncbi:MAG: restriction endonuclease FokI C-terminal domain-containing protein [Oscillospiraceae bacterium]
MINILPTQTRAFRTFGWVQDPGNFRSLCDVTAIFDESSEVHARLRDEILPAAVEERDGKTRLIAALSARPLRISYGDLVGTSFTPRPSARCNGIVQAAVKGQRRPFIGDWPADNFVRWAQAFGFISYSYSDDSFEITEEGRRLTAARTSGGELNAPEREIMTDAIIAYPPAVRVLRLLAEEDAHLTKFELGKKLGFVGEDGFTSLPQGVLIRELAATRDAAEKNRMKADWDGSSDKYARMIAGWLQKLGLCRREEKRVTVVNAGKEFTESISHAYVITAAGLTALKRADGISRHARIAKNVSFEMMATKGGDREYVRSRRTYVLKYISECGGAASYEDIRGYLSSVGLRESTDTIRDDIQGLVNIGLSIKMDGESCRWNDAIRDFTLPLPQELTKSELTERKERLRDKLSCLPHDYLALIDLAYDGKQNRLFEMKVVELLTEECGFKGQHLGGGRRPDGVAYTKELPADYGLIIDTKAYSGGYSLPISQADEMERYVRENQTRNALVNPNLWWESFDPGISEFHFVFISGHFKGNVKTHIERIGLETGVTGGAVGIEKLLLLADGVKSGSMTLRDMLESILEAEE